MVVITYAGRKPKFILRGMKRSEADAAVLAHLQRYRFEVAREPTKTRILGDTAHVRREVDLSIVSAVWIDDTDATKTEPLTIPTKLPKAAR